MTSNGSKYGAPNNMLQRALKDGDLHRAIVASKELPRVRLADAAQILNLLAKEKSPLFDRAAARWLTRYAEEVNGITADRLADIAIAVAALPDLSAAELLAEATKQTP